MHADIISPKYHPSRPKHNNLFIPRTARYTKLYMLHADAAAWTRTWPKGNRTHGKISREHAVAAIGVMIHQLLLFKLRPSTRAAVDSRPRGRVDGGGGRAEGGVRSGTSASVSTDGEEAGDACAGQTNDLAGVGDLLLLHLELAGGDLGERLLDDLDHDLKILLLEQ